MRDFFAVREISTEPGVYALLGYSVRGLYTAYVGVAGNVRDRVSQHLEYRNSSVTTGASAVSLDPMQVGGCRWWTDPSFSDGARLGATELVAFKMIEPVLRSRGGINSAARQLSKDPGFQAWAERPLKEGAREVKFPGFRELAQQVRSLHARVEALEAALLDATATSASGP